MMGKVSKIWKNKLDDGRTYATLSIDGVIYTLWNNKYMESLKEGDTVEYDFKQSGKYKNITNIDKRMEPPPGDKNNNDFNKNFNNGYNNTISPAMKKDKEIVRMSCLKSAINLMRDFVDLDLNDRMDNVIDIAKKFEKYVTDFEEISRPDNSNKRNNV